MLKKIQKHLTALLSFLFASWTTAAQLATKMLEMADEYTMAFVAWTVSVVLACSALFNFFSNRRVNKAAKGKDDEIAELKADRKEQEKRDEVKTRFAALSKPKMQLLHDMRKGGDAVLIANEDMARMLAAESLHADGFLEPIESLSQGLTGCYFKISKALLEDIAGNEEVWAEALEKAGVPDDSVFPAALVLEVKKKPSMAEEYARELSRKPKPKTWHND